MSPKVVGFRGFAGPRAFFAGRSGSKWVEVGRSGSSGIFRAFFAGRSGSSGIYLAVPNFLIGRKNPNFPKVSLGKLEV